MTYNLKDRSRKDHEEKCSTLTSTFFLRILEMPRTFELIGLILEIDKAMFFEKHSIFLVNYSSYKVKISGKSVKKKTK